MLFTDKKISPMGQVNEADLQRWAKNAVIFLAPAVLLFLLSIQAGRSVKESLTALELWGLNSAIDLVRKFINDSK